MAKEAKKSQKNVKEDAAVLEAAAQEAVAAEQPIEAGNVSDKAAQTSEVTTAKTGKKAASADDGSTDDQNTASNAVTQPEKPLASFG